MVKIRISYEKPEELTEVLRRLHPVGNIRQQDKGRYKKAYIDMELMNTIRARGQLMVLTSSKKSLPTR